MNRYRRRRFRTAQDIATLLLWCIGAGWIFAGWWVFARHPLQQALMLLPYMWLSMAFISVANCLVADWGYFISRPSRTTIVVYFVSLVGMVATSVASLNGTIGDIGVAAMSVFASIHGFVWRSIALRR